MKKSYDVIIVGGGHAGCEAALAAAKMGCSTLLITISKNTIGLMPCNPSIGGPAKGQIVGEIDALGGEMGRAADNTFIQLKVLNRSRGPAVQCLRSQNDKFLYEKHMQTVISDQANIDVCENEVTQLIFENDTIKGLITKTNQHIEATCIVITTGTFLKAKMHVGLTATTGGRIGEQSAENLSESLRSRFKLGRLKTGTPPRLHKDSIDYSKLIVQPGDPEWLHFSFKTPYNTRYQDQKDCYSTNTTEETHNIILNNLDRSPLFTKTIEGVGPRYCPSIEDKIVRFKDKPSHQIFIEPEGLNTDSIYPQGLNTSLPQDVQEKILYSMPGLENVIILKYGYAVEYDFILPSQLKPTLETKTVAHLFFAGQINGTSGYEEAAGQGLIAGINAALVVQKKDPFILKREDSFIGTLIDDLITKNIYEPYRMLTSRSEYRLLLRQDNPTNRLSERAYAIGLLTSEEIDTIRQQHEKTNFYLAHWKKTSTNPDQTKHFNLKHKIPIADLLKRPEVQLSDVFETTNNVYDKEAAQKACIEIKYAGYINKQQETIAKIKRFENKHIPDNLNFETILGLRKESIQQLSDHRPKTFYEASKIAGVNPADLVVLMVYLENYHKKNNPTPKLNHK